MNIGLVPLDGTLHFLVLSENTSDVPTAADAAPTYTIYGPDGTAMTNGTGTTAAVSGKTGLYRGTHSISTADGYAAGSTYHVYAQWALSAVNKAEHYSFNVT
jgi:hypothetical protein